VGLEGETICFVEVKARSSARYGRGAEAVGPAKRRRLVRLARLFLAARGTPPARIRFDVVEVFRKQDGALDGRVIKGAFFEDGSI
jgi:putative endonuclease